MTDQQYDRWFNRTKSEFSEVVLPFSGKPATYVEIGCWAGSSAEWVCKNILTHPDAKGFGIDPHGKQGRHSVEEMESIRNVALRRVAATGVKWKWIRKISSEGLCNPEIRSVAIDILYVDGDHEAYSVIMDFALAWPMLHAGSVVIFDDYVRSPRHVRPHVREATEAIENIWGPMMSPIGAKRRQRAYRVEQARTYMSDNGLGK